MQKKIKNHVALKNKRNLFQQKDLNYLRSFLFLSTTQPKGTDEVIDTN